MLLGHDPKWVLKWKSRILSSSKLTLEVFGSQSRAPKHISRRTSPEAKAIIGELRRDCLNVIIARRELVPSNMGLTTILRRTLIL